MPPGWGASSGLAVNPQMQRMRMSVSCSISPLTRSLCCTGLPEAWQREEQQAGTEWEAGRFSLQGELPETEENV